MPLYEVEDDSGRKFTLEGDSEPTEQELEEIFASSKPETPAPDRFFQSASQLQNFLTATTPTQIRQPRALGPDRAVTGVAGANITPFDPNQLPGIQDPFIDLGIGVIDLGEAAVGLTSMPTFGATGKFLEKTTGYDPDFAREWLGEFYSPSRKQAQQEVGKAKGFLGTSKALLENPSIIGETITRSLPAVLGGGATGRGVARVAPKLGSIWAAAVGEGAVASGMAAEQFRGQNESGFLSPKQATLATTTGLTTVLVGILGGKVGKYLGVDDVDALLTKGASSPAARSATVVKLIKGAISEGVIEELPQTVLEQIQANIATGKPWSEGVPEGAAQGLFAGLGMGAGANVVSPLMSGRSQSVLDEQDIIPPQFDAAAVERAAIEGGRGQRRVGVRIPEGEFAQPGILELADEALREAQSPIRVPGRTPAIDLLRNELLPPTLAQAPRTTATRTREAGETLVRPSVEGIKVEPGFERTASDRLQERDRTGALEGRPEFTAEENAAVSEAISEIEASGNEVSDALKKRFAAPPYREPRTPQQRKSKADMEAEMQRESGYYLDEPVNQSLPEPPPQKPREGTTLVNPATGRKIIKPTVLSNLQRSRLMKALERGADETTIRNIIRSPEPEIDETSLRLDESSPSPKAQTFVEAMASDRSITNRSDDPSMVTTQDTGMNLGSVADLDAMLESFRQLATETASARERMRSGTLQPQEMMQLAARMQKRQLPREVVETATNIGAWADDKPIVRGKLGERPLDWRKNPEVAAWLIKNGPELGIDVSDVQSEGTSLSQTTPATEITIPPKSEVQSVVDQLQKDYPGAAPVVVVENYHELPDSAHQAAYRQGGNPVGITGAVSGGKVYIVSNNLESAEEARQIWLHEQAGHFATDKILGPKLQKFMEQVADSFAGSELMTDIKSRYKNASKSRLGREFVARLAENPQAAPNLWNRIVAQFRAWLRDIGWVKQVSENDIRVLLNRSMESLAKKADGMSNEDASLSFSSDMDFARTLDSVKIDSSNITQIKNIAESRNATPELLKYLGDLEDFHRIRDLRNRTKSEMDKALSNVFGDLISKMGENRKEGESLTEYRDRIKSSPEYASKRSKYEPALTSIEALLEDVKSRFSGEDNPGYVTSLYDLMHVLENASNYPSLKSPNLKALSNEISAILFKQDPSLSLKTAAQAAAARYPAPATAATPPAGTPPTPPTTGTPIAAPTPAGGTPATTLDDVYKIFEPSPKAKMPLKERGARFIEAIRTGFSSKFRPLNKLAQDIAKAYGRTSPKDVAGIFEQLNGSQGKAEADIYRFDQAVSKLVEGDEKDFSPYMFLRRSLDRLNQDAADIERAVAGEDVKKLNRRSVADYTIPQLEADLAALEQKLGPEKVSKFEQAAELYQQHMDAALRLQVESGRMSQKVYDAIKEGNQFYAPFKVMKYLEETSQPEGSGRRVDTLADFTKAMEGIEDADFRLGDMLAAARQSILMSRILADKNTAMRNVSELAAFDPDGMFIRRLKDGQKPQRGFEAVNVLEAGKPVRYEVNQDVSKALQIYGSTGADMFTRALSLMSTPFRAGATALNIPFQVGNLLIDTTRAALVSKYGTRTVQDMVQYPLDFVQAIYSSMKADMHGKQNKLYQDFLDSGVAGTTIQEYLTPEALKFKEPTSISKSAKLAQSVLSTIPRFAKAIEQTNKVLGVKRAMRIEGVESGKQLAQQVPEAITELRRFSGSPDFGRMGSVVDQYRLNIILMFFNARLQGTILDVGRLGGRDGGKVAAQTWLKLGMPVAIATAFLYALNNRDEYKEDYEQRPDQEKENYWLIPKDSYITNDRGEKMRDYWRIPKREISKWVANMTEQALDFAKRRDPKALADFGVRMAEELTPVNITGDTLQERTESVLSGLNPLLKMPLELGTGRSFYRHQDIIPENMKDASPESQFKPRTAEAFKKLGEAMPDFMPEALRSPLILENLTQNLTAGMITQFLPTPPVEGRSKLENTPLLRRFQAVPYTDDGGEQEMLDELKREAADERLKRHREATSLIDSNPGKSLSEILKMAPRDEKFLNHFADLWVAKENGITGRERQIIALPVRQRAAYVADQLSRLEGEAKQLKFQELARKRILTEAVYQELPNVMK